jgi:hypothetical protein
MGLSRERLEVGNGFDLCSRVFIALCSVPDHPIK